MAVGAAISVAVIPLPSHNIEMMCMHVEIMRRQVREVCFGTWYEGSVVQKFVRAVPVESTAVQ